jgi:serine/threonine protein kinase
MEFAPGGELFDYIVAKKRFLIDKIKFLNSTKVELNSVFSVFRVREDEACKFFQQILGGIEYIHKLNIVHRYQI